MLDNECYACVCDIVCDRAGKCFCVLCNMRLYVCAMVGRASLYGPVPCLCSSLGDQNIIRLWGPIVPAGDYGEVSRGCLCQAHWQWGGLGNWGSGWG